MASAAALLIALSFEGLAQQAQNPSPMVEHAREHPRLIQRTPPGRREKLVLGTLFVPDKARSGFLLVFFHGGSWLPEVAAAAHKNVAVITVQAGAGAAAYSKLFDDPALFPRLIAEAETRSGLRFLQVELGGWSAGCGAIRRILQDPAAYARVSRVLCIDGVHTGYADGHPGPKESELDTVNLAIYVRLARDAIARRKRVIITHSEIFPGTFASTTETADYLVRQLGLPRHAVLQWGPMKTQVLSEIRKGNFLLLGLAGNSAPDHVDQLHSLPEYLRWLNSPTVKVSGR